VAARQRRRAIPTRKPTKRAPRRTKQPRSGGAAGKPARPARAKAPPRTAARKATRARPKRPRAEQPLGAGVGDAFAVRRLMKSPAPRPRHQDGVREIGWAEFGALAGALADRIAARWSPDVVLGIANAGVFVGGALAPSLGAELLHLHLPGRGAEREKLPSLAGKRVLVVDDLADTGRTLARASALAKQARAAEVRTAVVVLRPGGATPDWHALETSDVTIFGWDYRLAGGGPDDPGDAGA
jgi:adenine/guanine phosphoribosyltransferase-like PRPP-binding protein